MLSQSYKEAPHWPGQHAVLGKRNATDAFNEQTYHLKASVAACPQTKSWREERSLVGLMMA